MLEKFRYITAGESHGRALVCTVDGIPSGLSLSPDYINKDLARRQKGYGRGGRMKIESDHVQILSGIRCGETLGSPISMLIENKDWSNWEDVMSAESKSNKTKSKLQTVTRPRPGHADLSGALKYGHKDLRNVLERSSARETAARVAAGAVARKLLSEFHITVISYVTEIGGVELQNTEHKKHITDEKKILSLFKRAEKSPVRCPDKKSEAKMINRIDKAIKKGDSVGGIFEIVVLGVPAGLGSYSQWDKRLNAKLAFSLMGTQAIKGVEIGLGFETSRRSGSEVMDEIFYRSQTGKKRREPAGGFYRKTNNAGGIEGGISNGMPIVVRAAMKPIPTLKSPLSSVDVITKNKFRAAYERSDICAVPAASIISEAVTAIALADSFLEKFGGDSMIEIKRNYDGYLGQINNY
jgi:chorismate synthase